jgi:hypothetical protein
MFPLLISAVSAQISTITYYGGANCTGSPKHLVGTFGTCTAAETCLDTDGKGTFSAKLSVCYENQNAMVTALGTTEPYVIMGTYSDKSTCSNATLISVAAADGYCIKLGTASIKMAVSGGVLTQQSFTTSGDCTTGEVKKMVNSNQLNVCANGIKYTLVNIKNNAFKNYPVISIAVSIITCSFLL